MHKDQIDAGATYRCRGKFFRTAHAIQEGCVWYIGSYNSRLAMIDGKRTCRPLSWFAERAIEKI